MGNDYFLRNGATIAIITGGTQGLGLAIAKRLAREGARGIILSGRSLDKGEDAAASVNSMGTECFFVKADISVPEDCYHLVAAALERFGSVNGLVHRLAYSRDVAAGQLAVFQGASEAPISRSIRVERATRKNSQMAAARRVALKMGRRLRCSSVTYRFRYAPSSRLAGGPF
jgi:NAD(P)-dependent dehydrogenase (short-subunit alcohol dehydrogenase family)